VFVSHPFNKCLLPRALRLPLRKMRIELPMSCSVNSVVGSDAIVVVFNIFPVKMNVLDAVGESCAKPNTACCAATKALVVLMFRSRVKFAKGMERGSFSSFGGTPAPAA